MLLEFLKWHKTIIVRVVHQRSFVPGQEYRHIFLSLSQPMIQLDAFLPFFPISHFLPLLYCCATTQSQVSFPLFSTSTYFLSSRASMPLVIVSQCPELTHPFCVISTLLGGEHWASFACLPFPPDFRLVLVCLPSLLLQSLPSPEVPLSIGLHLLPESSKRPFPEDNSVLEATVCIVIHLVHTIHLTLFPPSSAATAAFDLHYREVLAAGGNMVTPAVI